MKAWLKPISKMGACKEAIEWGENYESLEEAWQACERGDWMLWLVGKLSGAPESKSRKRLVLATCECARLALPFVREGERRPLRAIEITEAWANGDTTITLDMIRNAAYAAADAAADADADVGAGAAAYAAAAYAAYAAAYAYDAAAYAAYAAAYAYDAAYADAARSRRATLKKCADIIRKHYQTAPKRRRNDTI